MKTELPFTGVEHIGIKALNMEKALDFYREVLGFKFLYQIKPGDVELAFLELGGTVVELVEVIDGRRFEDGVINHLALRVTDIFKAIDYLQSQQVEMPSLEPMSLGEGRYNFFFHGPSGEKIELYQG
ncbi:VOC family protein [Desulfosporosinus sp. PR]|uniref:VOC family protein n=1 Tax=Candidatus Desulfosporosinus nitrosoreducens TaxID=3401928 RepID=UPI0027FEEBF9|nr:VOC family protein [Desulfosporosinus sp. PR]MDQ7093105.1 VOC family protein [Desulfosporosinus sp. PR]